MLTQAKQKLLVCVFPFGSAEADEAGQEWDDLIAGEVGALDDLFERLATLHGIE